MLDLILTQIKNYEFDDEVDTGLQIIRNQLDRRNISVYCRVELEQEEIIKAKAKKKTVVYFKAK